LNFINLNIKEDEKDNFISSNGTNDKCSHDGTEREQKQESESNRYTSPVAGSGSDSGSEPGSERDQKSGWY
jgi:hypothetical protein